MSTTTISQLEEHYGEPQRSEDGTAICGRGKKAKGICRFEAGWEQTMLDTAPVSIMIQKTAWSYLMSLKEGELSIAE